MAIGLVVSSWVPQCGNREIFGRHGTSGYHCGSEPELNGTAAGGGRGGNYGTREQFG